MKLIKGCLLAVAVFGCLAYAQFGKSGDPQRPQPPQKPSDPQRPQPPQKPSDPQRPHPPPRPKDPQRPQPPQKPSDPQRPHPPPRPKDPQRPQPPQKPSDPQRPQPPQKPSDPQRPHPPPRPKDPQRPQPPQKPSDPQRPQPPQKPNDYPSCDVESNDKIQCGPPGISAADCDSIHCCHDGRMCYYGKYVTLQCTKGGYFIVVISKDATLPALSSETIYFYGTGNDCQPVGVTSSFVIYMFPVTACGTLVTDEPDVLVYENRLYSTYEITDGERGMITRDTSFDLFVQCRYYGASIEALVIEVNPVPPPPPVAALGPIHVGLYLGNGQCTTKGCIEEEVAFTSYYMDADYPIAKVLRDPVYVDVALLGRTDPNLVLTLGRCWVTAGPSPTSYPQWDLIIDGCPNRDDNYPTKLIGTSSLPYPGHHRRFVFKMFTFLTGVRSDPTQFSSQMYIHCNTSVCIASSTYNCEPKCFRKKRDIAASAVKRPRPEIITVSSKAIEITS
uniref:Zona pellucida sperm-binding protein 4 n=1 Tax=Tetraodon nigroviridis TaxID=99883 RepID=H3C089_TETNG